MNIHKPKDHDFLLKTDAENWLHFENPNQIILATSIKEILPALEKVVALTHQGFYAAGFIGYEAASAFDNALSSHLPEKDNLPLLWFGIYQEPTIRHNKLRTQAHASQETSSLNWLTKKKFSHYKKQISTIKSLIAAGETYQVNFTQRLIAETNSPQDSWLFFTEHIFPLDSMFSAYWQSPDFALASASPELFFEKSGTKISCRPMKGTAPRGNTPLADKTCKDALAASKKDTAENVMIVDMIRNDLGRIAQNGSVVTENLFSLEKYSTLWQMTSSVQAQSTKNLLEIFTALFPCASITGAPKVQTMKIIKDIEENPRGLYTGCIGYIRPNQDARFNVAIRTATFNHKKKKATYGVGGGIVWDSTAENEFEECKTKSRILTKKTPDFDLFETLLFTPQSGFFLLNRHLKRLYNSAHYFNRQCDLTEIERILYQLQNKYKATTRVRLQLVKDGSFFIEEQILTPESLTIKAPWKIQFALTPVDTSNTFLYHKTTHREIYDNARKNRSAADIILFNQHDEITESTIANIIIKENGSYYTPPLSSGLLPGTYREELLEQGKIVERPISKEQCATANEIWLINSVRKWIPTILTE